MPFSTHLPSPRYFLGGGINLRQSSDGLFNDHGFTYNLYASFDAPVSPFYFRSSKWNLGFAFVKEEAPYVSMDGMYGKLRFDLTSLFRNSPPWRHTVNSLSVGVNFGGVQHRVDFSNTLGNISNVLSIDNLFKLQPDWSAGITTEIRFLRQINLFGNLTIPPTLGIDKVYGDGSPNLLSISRVYGTTGARFFFRDKLNESWTRNFTSQIRSHFDISIQALLEKDGQIFPFIGAYYFTRVNSTLIHVGGSYGIDQKKYFLNAGFSPLRKRNKGMTIRTTIESISGSIEPSSINIGVIYGKFIY